MMKKQALTALILAATLAVCGARKVYIENRYQFEAELEMAGNDELVVVHFKTSWTNQEDERMASLMERIEQKAQDDLVSLIVDAGENFELALAYDIKKLPTFVLIRKQQTIDEVVGAEETELIAAIKEQLGRNTSTSTSRTTGAGGEQ